MRPAPLVVLLVALFGLRLAVAGAVELSGPEALVWAAARDAPLAHPLDAAGIAFGEALLGRTALAVRLAPAALGVLAVAVAALATRSLVAAVVVGALPGLALLGLMAGPTAGLTAGLLVAWAGAARDRPAALALGWAIASLSHGVGLFVPVLAILANPAIARRRGALLPLAVVGGGLAAWLGLAPGASERASRDLLGGGQAIPEAAFEAALVAGPVVLLAVVLWGLRSHRAGPDARVGWWLSAPLLVAAVGHLGEPAVATAAMAVGATALLGAGGRLTRLATVGAGMNAVVVTLVGIHMVHPILDLDTDPRAPLVGGEILAGSIEGWGIPVVYTELPEDAALLRFHLGLDAGPYTDPPQSPSLYVRPWAADRSVPGDADGRPRSGPHVVTAAVTTPDPLGHRVVARWQVYALGDRWW